MRWNIGSVAEWSMALVLGTKILSLERERPHVLLKQ
jgi:hypothetical protein